MRILYLLRHAKSSWKNESKPDFERPLAGRGRKACEIVASLIQAREIQFDLVLCSTAIRARETIDLVNQYAKLRTEIRFDERIYEATAMQLLELVSQIENDRKSVLLVGHNPGFEDLLYLLTGENHRFPTASLAKIKLKLSKWSDAYDNKAALDWIARPKEWEQS
jgi:phosphohistidine phosphatase